MGLVSGQILPTQQLLASGAKASTALVGPGIKPVKSLSQCDNWGEWGENDPVSRRFSWPLAGDVGAGGRADSKCVTGALA